MQSAKYRWRSAAHFGQSQEVNVHLSLVHLYCWRWSVSNESWYEAVDVYRLIKQQGYKRLFINVVGRYQAALNRS